MADPCEKEESKRTKSDEGVRMVYGTMLFGGQIASDTDAERIIDEMVAFASPNPAVLDTARLYQQGVAEHVIGRILGRRPDLHSKIEIHTKADPSITRLDAEGLELQLSTSLNALRIDSVQVYYLHMPDTRVNEEETLMAMNSFVQRKLIREIGLSNYPSWMVVALYEMCLKKGWQVPTVYQGVYHLLSRSIEYELVPALRYLSMRHQQKIRLHIFSPLCGGLLTGRYLDRATSLNSTFGRYSPEYHNHHLYVERYFHPENFVAINMLNDVARRKGLSLTELAIRWLRHHSKLISGDALVFGASSIEQLKENLACAEKGPLDDETLQVIASAAVVSRPVEAEYYRGYDKQHGRADRWLAQFM